MSELRMEDVAGKVWQKFKKTLVYQNHPKQMELDKALMGGDAFVPFKSPLVNFVTGHFLAPLSNARSCPFDFSGMPFHADMQLIQELVKVPGGNVNQIRETLEALVKTELAEIQQAQQERSGR